MCVEGREDDEIYIFIYIYHIEREKCLLLSDLYIVLYFFFFFFFFTFPSLYESRLGVGGANRGKKVSRERERENKTTWEPMGGAKENLASSQRNDIPFA